MEVHPGIHVSSIGTGDWEPDLEVGGEMMCFRRRYDDAFAGLSRFVDVDIARGPWTMPARETILILEAASIEIEGGPTPVAGRRHGVDPEGGGHDGI